MLTLASPAAMQYSTKKNISTRIQSIDLLRGIVMIIMALDHVRDYFHNAAFMYSPEDLSQTNAAIFLTRWVTHFCAPVFVFLAGTSAYLYGAKRSKKELAYFLWTRGIFLVLVEIFIVNLFRTFNLSYTFLNTQVIWAIGISMIVMSVVIHINRHLILLTAIILVGGHNLLDNVHMEGSGLPAILWSILHDPNHFSFGNVYFTVRYPIIPWVGIMLLGYYAGNLYVSDFDPLKRRKILRLLGTISIILFIILRFDNWYGDAAYWSEQENIVFSLLSFINVTKYPPSLLYTLITLGPALLFLSFTEKPIWKFTNSITLLGRVAMFYYLAHILLIHILAIVAALITGYPEMIVLNRAVNSVVALKGYGFSLFPVYLIWIAHVLILYPFCKWFDHYKRKHQSEQRWLSYL